MADMVEKLPQSSSSVVLLGSGDTVLQIVDNHYDLSEKGRSSRREILEAVAYHRSSHSQTCPASSAMPRARTDMTCEAPAPRLM